MLPTHSCISTSLLQSTNIHALALSLQINQYIAMSDPHQQSSGSVSFFLESLMEEPSEMKDPVEQCFDSCSDYLGLPWEEMDFGTTPPSSDVSTEEDIDAVIGTSTKKRKWSEEACCGDEGGSAVPQREQRQRGKNWEKAEEDILVECKSKQMDWKMVSECLQMHGFTRNHKHCADKWYALRKHYLEVNQWMIDHPGVDYWDRSSNTQRIRSVPPSFCLSWYRVFDAAEKREGRKSSQGVQKQRRLRVDTCSGGGSGAGAVLNATEGLQELATKLKAAAMMEEVKQEDHCSASTGLYGVMEAVVNEIQNLRHALTMKFAAEERERSRTLAIQEKKLELKRLRFDYQRRRDEEDKQSLHQFSIKASS